MRKTLLADCAKVVSEQVARRANTHWVGMSVTETGMHLVMIGALLKSQN